MVTKYGSTADGFPRLKAIDKVIVLTLQHPEQPRDICTAVYSLYPVQHLQLTVPVLMPFHTTTASTALSPLSPCTELFNNGA